jgi:chemotaxis response regulator CheB
MNKKRSLHRPAARRTKLTDGKSPSVDRSLPEVREDVVEQQESEALRDDANIRVVAIGGSSGSLDALVQLLSEIEPNTEMSFSFIQHIDPTHESMLAEILNRSIRMRHESAHSLMRSI